MSVAFTPRPPLPKEEPERLKHLSDSLEVRRFKRPDSPSSPGRGGRGVRGTVRWFPTTPLPLPPTTQTTSFPPTTQIKSTPQSPSKKNNPSPHPPIPQFTPTTQFKSIPRILPPILPHILPLILLLTLTLLSCGSPHLEKSKIPLLWGCRLDDETTQQDLQRNIDEIKSQDLHDLLIEIPIHASSQPPFYPAIDSIFFHQIAEFAPLLKAENIQYHLCLTPYNIHKLFPTGRIEEPTDWFFSFARTLDSLLARCGEAGPERVIIGSNLFHAEAYPEGWKKLFERIRFRYKVKISYGASISRASEISFWSASDELCLSYPPSPEENPKPFCRKHNLNAADLADSLKKPVFIFRANLVGPTKKRLFENRLRFWPEETKILGLTLNSLYPRIACLDTSSYFKLNEDQEFWEFWEEYRSR